MYLMRDRLCDVNNYANSQSSDMHHIW